MNEHIILTDIDGVCLYWEGAFDLWMRTVHGKTPVEDGTYCLGERFGLEPESGETLANEFNRSEDFGFCGPVEASIKYIRKLHEEHGYSFVGISAVEDDDTIFYRRNENLKRLYGAAFTQLALTGSSENKRPILEKFKDTGCFWLEDVTKNAEMGFDYGLKPILFNRHYNLRDETSAKRVSNWREVYEAIAWS